MATPAEDAIQKWEGQPADWLAKADAASPVGRILRPWDVAKTVLHLLSDDSEMRTGDVLNLSEMIPGAFG